MITNIQMQRLKLFHKYFILRTDTYAEQVWIENSQDWRFIRSLDFNGKGRELTPERLAEHFDGKHTLGVYALHEGKTKWLCLDVDIGKDVEHTPEVWDQVKDQTKRISAVLLSLGIPYRIEESGRRGMHVWVFFDTPADADSARHLGRAILSKVAVTSGLGIEIYPKQSVAEFGNLVKLPFGIHRKTGKRTQLVNNDLEPFMNQWKVLERTARLDPSLIPEILSDLDYDPDEARFTARSDHGRGLPCFNRIVQDGVSPGGRDTILFRLAVYWKNQSMDEEIVQAAMDKWNERNTPPIPLERIDRKIRSAFSNEYSHYPCQETVFDPYCSTSCRFYESKMRQRGGTS